MRYPLSRPRSAGRLYCTLCGREISPGEEYWACNGSIVCPDCLSDFARREFISCREIRGKECRYDTV